MPEFKMTMQGERQLDRLLDTLVRKFGAAAVSGPIAQAMHDALARPEIDIRAATPVDTGRLRNRHVYREAVVKNGRLLAGTGYRFRNRRDVPRIIAAGVLEFGGPGRPAKRTLRKIFEKNRTSIDQTFRKRFDEEFEKTALAAGAKRGRR